MKELQLTELLKSFDKEELKSFKKFLSTSFNQSRRNIGLLLEHSIQFYPEFDSSKYTKEEVFRKIFPDEEFQEKKIMNFVFDLTEAAKNFIMINTLIENKTDSQIYTARGLYKKKLLNQSMRLLNKAESELEPGFSSAKDYFAKKKSILSMKIGYHLANNDFEKLKETQNEYYEISTIQFFVDYTWMRCTDHTTVHTVFNKDKSKNEIIESITDSFDVEKLLSLSDKFNKKLKHLTELHYYVLKTVNEPKEPSSYYELKKLFYGNIERLDREEKFQLLSHMINFCGENIVNYEEDFAKEMLDIYKTMLEHRVYSNSESEYLLFTDYRNILMLSMTYFDAAFIRTMIKEHYKLLKPDQQKDVLPYSYACLYFLEGKFEKTLEMVAEVEKIDFGLKFDLRTLKLLTYFELDHIEQVYSLIDSYKHYIKNSKEANDARRKSRKLFLDAFLILMKIRTEKDFKLIPDLEMASEKLNFWLKVWIRKKAKELKKNRSKV